MAVDGHLIIPRKGVNVYDTNGRVIYTTSGPKGSPWTVCMCLSPLSKRNNALLAMLGAAAHILQ
eukprot:3630872-Rhodomonas_salina.1